MVKTHTAAPDTVLPDKRVQIGHNGPAPDLVMYHMGLMQKAERGMKEAAALLKKAKQRAKGSGITLEDLADARMMLEMGPDKAIAKMARRLSYYRILQVPVGSQMQLFDSPVDSAAITQEYLIKQAFEWGRNLGVANEEPDWQKYQQNTDLGQAHQKGWYEGQQVFADLTSNNAASDAKEAQELQNKADEKKKILADKQAEKEAKKQERSTKKAEKVAATAAKKAAAPPARGKKKTDDAAKAKLADALN